MSENKRISLPAKVGDKTIIIETGAIAKQANGAATIRLGDTIILVTATCAKKSRGGFPDFIPMTVEYRERTYAAGRIPGGWFKREGRPREKEILSCRFIDRSIRPLFPKNYNIETQVMSLILSSDQKNDSDVLGIIGASAALMVSDIPWNGPIGAVRIGKLGGEFIVNPTFEERQSLEMEMVVAGTKQGIIMVEGGANEIPEETLTSAIQAARKEIDVLCDLLLSLREKTGKPKFAVTPPEIPEGLNEAVSEPALQPLKDILGKFLPKAERDTAISELKTRIAADLAERFPGMESPVNRIVEDLLYRESRRFVLDGNVRTDSRKQDEIRPINIILGYLPRTHGSALFTRGQTQALVTTTLGTPHDMQIMEELEGEFKERFLFHYNFPGFSTGEPKPERGPGRREIGHGALAKRAIYPLFPQQEEFAYTIRIVSDIMESNGSSSMASVCGSSLALFDAGVPLKSSCAGIAMGLIWEGDRHAILSDISGMEDHLGDMDFKIAGTRKGITAFQMDVKVEGIPPETLQKALEQARQGRIFILDKMDEALPAPKPQLSTYAPRLYRLTIPVQKIGALIGPGGKNIRRIQEETGAEIEVEDDGSVFVSGTDAEGVESAKKLVEYMAAEAEVGKIYKGKVVSVMDFGAFVEIFPGREGLVHISQLSDKHVARTEDVVKEGDHIDVKVIEILNDGKIKLSRKAILKPGSELHPPQKRHFRSREGPA